LIGTISVVAGALLMAPTPRLGAEECVSSVSVGPGVWVCAAGAALGFVGTLIIQGRRGIQTGHNRASWPTTSSSKQMS
jgi:hypothetical protein